MRLPTRQDGVEHCDKVYPLKKYSVRWLSCHQRAIKHITLSTIQTLLTMPSSISLFKYLRISRRLMVKSSWRLNGRLRSLSTRRRDMTATLVLCLVNRTIIGLGLAPDFLPTRWDLLMSFEATSTLSSDLKKSTARLSVFSAGCSATP